MARTLCERRQKTKKELAIYAELVSEPRFVCSKCGRAAVKKKYLCRARKARPASVEAAA
jgi:hypothetical protein